MAVGKEIRTKIGSIKSTQKITSAMQMVSASKMRKAQERMEATRPYATKIRQVIGHLASGSPEYKHKYLEQRETKRAGYIVVSTDRGLCGGLNGNLFRRILRESREHEKQNVEICFCLLGQKAASFFNSVGGKVEAVTTQMGDKPTLEQLIGSVKAMLDAFNEGRIDTLYLAYNRFVNTMTQETEIKQLLPLEPSQDKKQGHHWDYIYEPDAKELLEQLLVRFVESQVYQGVVENAACEQAARMVAMKSATDNAGDLIKELQQLYNKARQSAITQEISEIVSGAAAV